MGAYLSSPVTDKDSSEGSNEKYEYGICAMQGWRTDMEDAHMVVLDLHEKDENKDNPPPITSAFAVFDGHGGKEVALFCGAHLPEVIASTDGYKSGDMVTALKQAFLKMDDLLVMDQYKEELKALKASDDEEGGGGVAIDRDQIPEAVLEALGVTAEEGLVFKLVRSSDGAMELAEDGEEDQEVDGEDVTVADGAVDANGDGAAKSDAAVAGIVGGDQATGIAPEAVIKFVSGTTNETIEEDVGPAAGDEPSSSSVGKRKRAIGNMETDEDKGSEEREILFEDFHSRQAEEEEWRGPGAGCTAVCALVRDGVLYVANAGDSRCVLSRGGNALALTEDHKPNDPEEYARITKAGGFVADGRVNGSLNLSRALGDLDYKTTKELPAEQQMVTANPEVRYVQLQDDDEFLILACDGIWDILDRSEAVQFVRERLLMGKTPKEIAEEMCDHCLAPDTGGCGKGCDNMSVVVVTFAWSRLAGSIAEARKTRVAGQNGGGVG